MEANGFASALMSSRISANLKQTQLGKTIGVRQSTISSWERGLLVPVKENVARLKTVFPELPEPPGSKEIPKPDGNPNGNPGTRDEAARKHMSAAQRARYGTPRVANGQVKTPTRKAGKRKGLSASATTRENARLRKLLSDFSACVDLAREVLAKV